jgi:hypothetical protein
MAKAGIERSEVTAYYSTRQGIGKMTKKFFTIGCIGVLALAVAATSGCVGVGGPGFGVGSIPFPVLPNQQQMAEDHAFEKSRYGKVVILQPITDVTNHIALDVPSDDQVVRELDKARPIGGSVPGLETTIRNIKGITKDLIADYVDPPRVMPLVGPVQLHHAHYKCIIYFEEITHVGFPVPHMQKTEDGMEVLYIDCDHLHQYGGGDVHTPTM